MITKFKLFESPDKIFYNGKNLDVKNFWARPFAFDSKNLKAYVGGRESYHDISTKTSFHKFSGYVLKYPGRFWEDDKILSFWVYPKKQEFKTCIDNLGKASNIDFWDGEWKIEVYVGDENWNILTIDDHIPRNGIGYDYYYNKKVLSNTTKIIPIEEYTGSIDQPEELYLNHLNKRTDLKVPKGLGSKKVRKFKEWQKPFEKLNIE